MISFYRLNWFLVFILPVVGLFSFYSLALQPLIFQWWLLLFVPILLFISYFWSVNFSFFLGLSLLISLWSLGLPCYCVINKVQVLDSFFFDWINLPFLFLSSLFFPYTMIVSRESIRKNKNIYFLLLILIQLFLVALFSTNNFFVFYVFFELIAFPMFLLIGVYGSQPARIPAAYKFFIYTFLGSIFMLAGLISLYYFYGSCYFGVVVDSSSQIYFFFLVFFALAVKIPMVPFHLWLPEAHVEAPTGISVLLAALLLKTGGYGLIRFVLPMFPVGVHFWSSSVVSLGLISILFASWWATAQVDMKKTIAYSSVAHMNVCVLGLFCDSILAIQASTYMMLAHAFVSAGLFTGVGVIYDRYHTRNIRAISGLSSFMPTFYFWYFFLVLANFSFPFSGNFASELIVFMELISKNLFIGLVGGLTVFFSAIYSIWFFNRVFTGPTSSKYQAYQDLTSAEYVSLSFCVIGVLLLGIYSWEYLAISFEDYCFHLNYIFQN